MFQGAQKLFVTRLLQNEDILRSSALDYERRVERQADPYFAEDLES
jgi:hypothetical protein